MSQALGAESSPRERSRADGGRPARATGVAPLRGSETWLGVLGRDVGAGGRGRVRRARADHLRRRRRGRGRRRRLPPGRRLVRGVRPRRVAPAAGQPQRPADDRDRLRPARLAAAQADPHGRRADGRRGAGGHLGRRSSSRWCSRSSPAGGWSRRIDRLIVAWVFVVVFVMDVFSMLFVEQPGNVLLAFPSEKIYGVIDTTQRSMLIVFALADLRRDRRHAGARRRRRGGGRCCRASRAPHACCCSCGCWRPTSSKGPRSQLMIVVAYSSMLVVPAAFLAGLLRSRLARGGLAQLFRELGGMRGEALQAALGRTLGDPTLVLAYRLPDSQGHADAAGRPVLVPPVTPDRSSAPIEHDGPRGGGARLRRLARRRPGDDRGGPRRGDDGARERAPPRGVRGSARRGAGVAPAHRRGRRRRAPPARARPARRRAAAARRARAAAADDPLRHPPRSRGQAEQLVAAASDELADSLEELRELARGIHPAALDHGLASALESLATRSTVPTAVSCDAPEHVPPAVELAVYFVACEALANVGKYAEATTASVRLSRTRDGVAIEIADDGVGGADAAHGSGPARPGRPRRGARRASARHEPARGGNRGHRGAAVRVVIADDSIARARGHRHAPAARRDRGGGAGVVGPRSCCATSTEHEPDVAIVDIRMPPTFTDEGLRAAHEIRARHPRDRAS